HLEVRDLAVGHVAARVDHLEPVDVADGLRRGLDRVADGFVGALGGRAADLDELVDVVRHLGPPVGCRGPAYTPAPCKATAGRAAAPRAPPRRGRPARGCGRVPRRTGAASAARPAGPAWPARPRAPARARGPGPRRPTVRCLASPRRARGRARPGP